MSARVRRILRLMKWAGLALAGLSLVFAFLIAPYGIAYFVTTFGTRPMDLGLTTTPAGLGLDFEDVTFESLDDVSLSGWYLDGGHRSSSVICSHGLFRSRREVMERCMELRRAGFDVLLFDFRRHGKSGGDTVSLGYKERLDVRGAVRYVRQRGGHDRVVLLGVSMGAAASLLAASETPEVSAVVADSSFLSFQHTIKRHLELFFGLPPFPLAHEIIFFIEHRAGFRSSDFDIQRAVERIGDRPVLIIAGSEDRRMPPEIQRQLYRAARSPRSRFVLFEGATHGAAFRLEPNRYLDTVLTFLDEVLGGRSRAAGPTTTGVSD